MSSDLNKMFRREEPDPLADGRRLLPTHLWQRFILAAVVRGAGWVQRLPRARAMRMGERLGVAAYALSRRHRRQADRNLRLVFGETMTAGERDSLIRRVFLHFGKTMIDFLRAPALTPEDLPRLIRSCEGFDEYVRPALARGKGWIMLTAHIGNWELLGRWIAAQGVPLTAVAKDPKDPAFADYVRKMRREAGMGTLTKGSSARDLLRVLRRGEAIALLPDQNSADVFVPFFGIPTGTVAGPASLALHTGAALIPSYCLREPDDTYRLVFLPPIPAEASGDHDADVARIMTEANAVLEGIIRRHPDQWLWLHARWRSAFEEKHRGRWPANIDYETFARRWQLQ